MKSRHRTTLSLLAVAVGLALAPAQAALAQDTAQRSMDSAQRADSQAVAATTDAKPLRMRVMRTGSNIVRYRTDESLPLMEIDRTYIDRTGAATTPELLRTIPQVQVGR